MCVRLLHCVCVYGSGSSVDIHVAIVAVSSGCVKCQVAFPAYVLKVRQDGMNFEF